MLNFQARDERRHFVHKKLLKVATSFLPGPVSTVASLAFDRFSTPSPKMRPPAPRRPSPSRFDPAVAQAGSARATKCGGGQVWNRPNVNDSGGRCIPGTVVGTTALTTRRPAFAPIRRSPLPVGLSMQPEPSMPIHRSINIDLPCLIPGQRKDPITGECKFFIGSVVGPDDPATRVQVGNAVMGRYGAGYVPGSKLVDRAICLPGDVGGTDGICYPKKSLTNKERAWPAGRKPLLTGGDMRAISIAARAAARLERTQKRLQKIGLMKKPSRRAPAARPHTLQIKDSH